MTKNLIMSIKPFIKYTLAASVLAVCSIFASADTVHVAKKGETIFGIAHQYSVSVDQLLKWNPQASSGVKKGMSIVIKDGNSQKAKEDSSAEIQEVKETPVVKEAEEAKEAKDEVKEPVAEEVVPEAEEEPLVYVTTKKESLKSIAKKTGVKESTLVELNPFLDPHKVEAGEHVRLSDKAPYFDPVTKEEIVEEEAEEPELVAEDNAAINNGTNIMVLLPFMANDDERSKQAKYYADFYRGLLLAANDNNAAYGPNIEIIAYDTNGSIATIKEQLAANADNGIAVVIASEDEAQWQPILDFAAENNVFVLNMFNFKDQAFRTNPWIMQGNIDQTTMYEKAVEGIKRQFDGYIPVILEAKGARAEKEGFTSLLEESYAKDGKAVWKISFEDALSNAELDTLSPENKYVFIPQSGSLSVFNKVAGAILHKRQSAPDEADRFTLFGYPDWTAFRGETLELLHTLDAVIYSRFYFNEIAPKAIAFQKKFNNWYGCNTLEAVPDQGMMGYDAAAFLLQALRQGAMNETYSTPYTGIQSAFSFERIPDGGLLNTSLFLIRYQPGNTCSATLL